MTPLFRKQAVEHRRSQIVGRTALPRSSSRWVTVSILMVALGFVLAAFTVSLGKGVRLVGQLVPGSGALDLLAPQAGVVSAVNARTGDTVSKGTVLFVIASDTGNVNDGAGLASTRLQLEKRIGIVIEEIESRRKLATREKDVLDRRLRSKRQELRALREQIAIAEQRSDLRAQSTARYRALEKFFSPAQIEHQVELELQQRETVLALRSNEIRVVQEIEDLHAASEAADVNISLQIASLRADEHRLTQEIVAIAAKQQQIVEASHDGEVAAVNVVVGQHVVPLQPLGTLVAGPSTLDAVVYSDSNAVGFLRVGQNASLRLDSFPYYKYGSLAGRVIEVTRHPVTVPPMLQNASLLQAYAVRISLDRVAMASGNDTFPLRSGMRLVAIVESDHRLLWQWAIDPLINSVSTQSR